MPAKFIRTQNRRGPGRKPLVRVLHRQEPLSAVALDRYLTDQLHKTAGFDAVHLEAGYRLRAPDAHG
jgi:hypothetical protein